MYIRVYIYIRVYMYVYIYIYICIRVYIYIANGLQMSNHIPPSWLLSTWSSPCYCGGHWAPIGSKIWETCGQDKINWTYNISFGQNQGNLLQLLQLLTFSPQKKSQPKELEKFTNKMRDLDALSLSQQPITTLYDILMPPALCPAELSDSYVSVRGDVAVGSSKGPVQGGWPSGSPAPKTEAVWVWEFVFFKWESTRINSLRI